VLPGASRGFSGVREMGGRTVENCEANPASGKGEIMADKSPRQNMSKKAGKTLKEKRTDKHAKAEGANKAEIVPATKR
jgi:hypothetical protein